MTQAPRSLVVITGDGPEHRYVANRIGAAHEVAAILVCDPAPRRPWHRILRQSPPRFVDKALWRLYLRAIGDDRARRASLETVLGRDMCATFREAAVCHRVGRPKNGDLRRAIDEIRPDVIAVYGTSLIPDDVLAQARVAALNMHTGISPRYRGTGCAFWPIHEGEPDWIGATVHDCTAAVDGGNIHMTRRATIGPDDDLHAVFARAVAAGADAYVEVLERALLGTLAGQPQDLGSGREYRGAMRGLKSELRARRRLKRLQKAMVSGPETG